MPSGCSTRTARSVASIFSQYLKEFRENMEATLRAVRVEQPDGTYKPLEKKKKPLN